MRICWRWTVFKLGQMLWAWFSWWDKLFPLLPVRFSWPATISGGWKGLVYCRPIPILFSFFKPTKELINLLILRLYLKLNPFSNRSNILIHFIHYRYLQRASDRSQKKKPNFTGFLGTNSRKNRLILREFRRSFRANFTKKQSVKTANFVVIFRANFARNWSVLRWSDQHFYCSFNNNTLQKGTNGKAFNIMASAQFFAT